jgi:hypothetical protein
MQNRIFIATGGGLVIADANRTERELAGRAVTGIASDGRDGILAIVDRHSVLERDPDGHWRQRGRTKRQLECCAAIRDEIFAGGDDARLLRFGPGGDEQQLEGFDEVTGRDAWFAGGPPLSVRTISQTSDGAAILVNVHVGGIPRTIDRGVTWLPTIPIEWDVHQVCCHPSRPEAVAAAAAVGLCISQDGGRTWTAEQRGLHAPYSSAVAYLGDDILISSSNDHFASRSRLYRWGGQGPLRPVQDGLPEWFDGIVPTGCLAVREETAAVLDKGGHLYVSENAGADWAMWPGFFAGATGLLIG